ncbi:hypothetical protein ACA910_022440 [Epithemia clementina (nom. ined.)]
MSPSRRSSLPTITRPRQPRSPIMENYNPNNKIQLEQLPACKANNQNYMHSNNLMDDGGDGDNEDYLVRTKKGEVVLPYWFLELVPHDNLYIDEERWKQQLPQHSFALKNVAILSQWWMEATPHDTHDFSRPAPRQEPRPQQQQQKQQQQQQQLPHRRPPLDHPPRPASPVVTTYAQITLQSYLTTPPLSPLTLDTRPDDESKMDLYSPSWESVEDDSEDEVEVEEDEDDQSSIPASNSSVQRWIQQNSAVPQISGDYEEYEEYDDVEHEDLNEEDDDDDRNAQNYESEEHEECDIRSAAPGLSLSHPLNDDSQSETMSTTGEGSESTCSSFYAVDKWRNRNKPSAQQQSQPEQKQNQPPQPPPQQKQKQSPRQKPKQQPSRQQQQQHKEKRRQALLPPSSPRRPPPPPPLPHLTVRRMSSGKSSSSSNNGTKEQQPRKQPKSNKRVSPVNSSKKPKLSFGGRNFNPGSKGWDPKEWGISPSDPDFGLYQQGVKLPELYISAIMTYARAIGIIEQQQHHHHHHHHQAGGEELLPPASPHDTNKKRAMIPPPSASLSALSSSSSLSPSRSRGGGGGGGEGGDDLYTSRRDSLGSIDHSYNPDSPPKIVWDVVEQFNDMVEL